MLPDWGEEEGRARSCRVLKTTERSLGFILKQPLENLRQRNNGILIQLKNDSLAASEVRLVGWQE